MEDWPVICYICHSIQPLAECGLKWAGCPPYHCIGRTPSSRGHDAV